MEYQVNIKTYANGNESVFISEYSPDGYVGVLTDTVYEDGVDETNWCVFHGTIQECSKFIRNYGENDGICQPLQTD